uniref:Testis expressed 48 n=1 Tax=Rhinolophus ferrumequinum TaxID=59479 RepID=A0A671FEI9_RHIFE
MAVHQTLASKIFCLCCRGCKESKSPEDSTTSSQTLQQQPSTHGWRKDEFDGQNPKQANTASRLPLGQPLIQKIKSSTSSNDFEDMNTNVSQRGFYKRNLNRYSQNHWPFQPCLIGKP